MVSMKTAKCPTCGGIVFKLAGKASKLCHDECPDCRKKHKLRGAIASIPHNNELEDEAGYDSNRSNVW